MSLVEEYNRLARENAQLKVDKAELIADVHTIAHDLAYWRNKAVELEQQLQNAEWEFKERAERARDL